MRIGIVVGELSGDNLGFSLIAALKNIYPTLEIEGIVGPKLMSLGAKQLFPMERLAIMGFVEPLLRLPELLTMRNWLIRYFLDEPIDLYIGIDAPDFNLTIEKKLKQAGIPTVHYVSPSVWAWREHRIKLIKQAVDLMLTLFPFEEQYYQQHKIPVKFVGHPAADQIPLKITEKTAKEQLGYKDTDYLLALLPGSRDSEVKHLAAAYLQAAKLCSLQYPELNLIVPVVSINHQNYLLQLQKEYFNELKLHIVVGKTATAIAASDLVLVTSGTATLEVMLYKKPMVIAYKTNYLTYAIAKKMIKVPFIGLPNLLAQCKIVPELIQANATAKTLAAEILTLINSPEQQQQQIAKFIELHNILRQDASLTAATAIANMLGVT